MTASAPQWMKQVTLFRKKWRVEVWLSDPLLFLLGFYFHSAEQDLTHGDNEVIIDFFKNVWQQWSTFKLHNPSTGTRFPWSSGPNTHRRHQTLNKGDCLIKCDSRRKHCCNSYPPIFLLTLPTVCLFLLLVSFFLCFFFGFSIVVKS